MANNVSDNRFRYCSIIVFVFMSIFFDVSKNFTVLLSARLHTVRAIWQDIEDDDPCIKINFDGVGFSFSTASINDSIWLKRLSAFFRSVGAPHKMLMMS